MDVLDGEILRDAIDEFVRAWRTKLDTQRGVPTFYDHNINDCVQALETHADAIPWNAGLAATVEALSNFVTPHTAERFIAQVTSHASGRFVGYDDRHTIKGSDANADDLAFLVAEETDWSFPMSQGRFECLTWKGKPLFKTTFDLAIYQMLLWDLKPSSVIELGSGNGGSAIWIADMCRVFGLSTSIVSVDIDPPEETYGSIEFLAGDCEQIERCLTSRRLDGLPHPWLVIEDAHVNIAGVLSHLDPYTQPGDYIVIEDSDFKQEVIAKFLADRPDRYLVDSLYCDYFGRNASCAQDSIFRRTTAG